jgi:hypothetical protein
MDPVIQLLNDIKEEFIENEPISVKLIDNEGKNYAKKAKPITQHEKMRRDLSAFLKNTLNLDWDKKFEEDLPKKWKIAQDMLILPSTCFTLDNWLSFENETKCLWKFLAECFRVKRIAQENRVKPDNFRSPNLTLLYGNDPIVVVNNNGVK